MDKYELNIKVEQMKKLAKQKDYATAAKVADSIDFYRVKENKTLSLLADIYEASGKYEQAKDILIEAYARTSLGRRLAYRLVKVCVKSGSINEAEEFYEDFIEAAPRDNSKYILQYELATAKGEPMEKRINILETYLDDEMDEKWSFELAKLYHKSGQKDKCVRQCDDIILWFNDGKYVDKAMELKMVYEPLTKIQQAKYEERWIAKAPENLKVEDIKVKEFDAANRYNTVNIQKALKRSMDILMNEDEKTAGKSEGTSDAGDTKVIFTDEVVNSLLSRTVKDVRVPQNITNTIPLSPLLDMDEHGQIEMDIDEPADEQIEGQMTIEQLLQAYEERERRGEVPAYTEYEPEVEEQPVISVEVEPEIEVQPETIIEEQEVEQENKPQPEMESETDNETDEEMSRHELEMRMLYAQDDFDDEEDWSMQSEPEMQDEQAEDYIEAVDDDIEEIEEEIEDIFADESVGAEYKEESDSAEDDDMDDMFEVTTDLSDIQNALVEAAISDSEEENDENDIIRGHESVEDVESNDEPEIEEDEADEEVFEDDIDDIFAVDWLDEEEEQPEEDLVEEEIAVAEANEADDESGEEMQDNQESETEEVAEEVSEQIQEVADSEEEENVENQAESVEEKQTEVQGETSVEQKQEEVQEKNPVEQKNEEASKQETKKPVSNQMVKELIKEFVTKYSGVQGLDRQLLMVLQEVLINGNARIVVMGEVKSGKTALAIDLVKIVNKIKQVRGRKIAKINGEVLNEKNVSEYFEKLVGMDLIIEKAASLSKATIKDIIAEIEKDEEHKIVLLEDEKTNAENLFESNEELAKIFKCRVVVKQNKIRDWAVIAENYAKEKGYEIDEMGILALHAKIDELYAISLLISKHQIEAIIDNAISKSRKRGLGRVLRLFGKEREKVLKEEDF